jgi:tRNA (Thr-GGU) A37 N-methylase
MVHWTKDPANKAKLAKAAAKRARTRKKRGRRSNAKSAAAVRYGAKPNVIGLIRAELKEAQKRVTDLKAILGRYASV